MLADTILGINYDQCIIDEVEILEFYRGGAKISDLEYSYGYRGYLIKKFLAEEPALKEIGYIYRPLAKKQT